MHLRDVIRERLLGTNAPYNLPFVTNGIACTTASVITAALGISHLDEITDEDIQLIKKVHLLLVMYNAFQPGVFALSGWDLVGALPLDPPQVQDLATGHQDVNRRTFGKQLCDERGRRRHLLEVVEDE